VLDEDSGAYRVEVEAPGFAKKTVEARLGASINLGEIRL
jgi:HSP20 family molecular chaperone IbpA